MNTETPRSRAGRREWLGLAAIALPCLLYSMDLTVLNLALPRLNADLHPSATQLLWIVDIYGFLVAGFLVTMGNLGDRIGRRRLLLLGAAGFGAASLLAATSRSPAMLIASRAVLGVAGATLAPSTLALIRRMFADPRQRTFAIGVWVTSFSVGAAVGPLLGGVMLQHFWWGSVFLLAVPVMLILLVVGPILLPEDRGSAGGPVDLASAALSTGAVLAIIYGLKSAAEEGLTLGWRALAAVALGVVMAATFVRRQRRLALPLIDLGLFRSATFTAALGTFTLATLVMMGCYVFIGQYLQLVLGMAPLHAGLWLLPSSLSFVVGSMVAPVVVRRVPPEVAMSGGLALTAVGFTILSQLDRLGLGALAVGLATLSLGLAPIYTLGTDLVVGAAPPERAGAAAALSETSSELGGALGIALLGSLGTLCYRWSIAPRLDTIGLDAETARGAAESLVTAVTSAAKLPGPAAAALLSTGRTAFTRALSLVAVLSAVVMLGTSGMLLLMHRRGARSAQPAGVDGQASGTPAERSTAALNERPASVGAAPVS
jgi:MFS transporter, DHA2 family, multidrug resistance protein